MMQVLHLTAQPSKRKRIQVQEAQCENYCIFQVDSLVIFISKHKSCVLVAIVVEAGGFHGGGHVSV